MDIVTTPIFPVQVILLFIKLNNAKSLDTKNNTVFMEGFLA